MPGAEIKSIARKILFDSAPKIFYISLIFVILDTVTSELIFRLPGTSSAYSQFLEQIQTGVIPEIGLFLSYLRPVGLALAAVLWLLVGVYRAGFMFYCLKKSRGQDADYKDIVDAFAFFIKIITIMIITNVIVFLWSMLFIIPGVVASYRYRKAYFILFDDPEKSALQCIRESKRIMRRNKLDLFLLDISLVGWHILNLLIIALIPSPFIIPIIMVWLSPYTGISRATFYDNLLKRLAV